MTRQSAPSVMPAASESALPENESVPSLPFVEVRYALPALLAEVKRDRASSAFTMEKLDQPSITALFELQQKRERRDAPSHD
ncbi:MAG: hypothetical protein Q8M02_04360 [Candidatus Didemnitutus sp.]|nr:hypothetical protein [Candidatus Didemnitutus sp.]